MIKEIDPKQMEKPLVRCAMCDREIEHYNVFLTPTNTERNVCWQCLSREEKGFNAKRNFSRSSRHGVIPR